ncbi:hypothetical protein HYH03_005496 [Edaphochlamys debaryana]|uniref:Uncharacterized protein n=1 Tax=Edaphochlamys debaryana TaxID=47281 RepID=A0A835Y5B2_9CHLO|nr:hypothetical protein HYH03_005496 [Edaphochlamys debaryana]|eukprot:KAG2496263.1 hypothetical protein HYH03_005496 [Edaphochlamys debaryana]
MPPKKNEPPPPPPEDPNPFGIFVSITIPSATVVLDLPPDAPEGAAHRQTHLTLNIPGSVVPWASPPTAPSEGSEYHYNVVKHLRRPGGKEGLMLMINGKLTVTINDSATNAVLATAAVDELWGFAIGENTWSAADGLDLTPVVEVPEGVPKVRSARLSFASIALNERPLPEGADAAALAASPPPESELPPLLPYSYVDAEWAEKGNLVELALADIGPLPPGLQAASDLAAGKEAIPGKLFVSLGVGLPGGAPPVALTLYAVGGRLVAPAGGEALRRELLTPEAAQALRWQLEDGVPLAVEVARYLNADGFGDPANEAYHGAAPAPELNAGLLEAGATAAQAAGLALVGFADCGLAPCLPKYTMPAGKTKPVEEAQPPGSSAWAKAGTTLTVTLRFARPIVPAWSPPPPPPKSLLELIPPRDLSPKPPPTTAQDDFKAKVRSIARALAEEYKAVLPPPAEPGSDAAAAAASGAEARHKGLIFELNRSGKYAQMRDSLKTAVVALVREKYRKSGSMSPNEMALLYNDLYGTLLAATHSALNGLIDAAAARPRLPPPEPVPDKQRLGQLLELAAQAEATGNPTRAEALHQRRLLAKNDPQVWYEYGTFCLRRGARGRAEQCFRESLSLAPEHRPALLALLGCSVAEGRATDPAYLEAAEAAAHRLLEVAGAEALESWAALALVYKAFGEPKRAELASCEQEMARLERSALGMPPQPSTAVSRSTSRMSASAAAAAAAAAADSPRSGGQVGELQAQAFVSLASSLLDALALPAEALLALDLAAGLRTWAQVGPETRTAHALATALSEQALAREGSVEALLGPGGPALQLMRAGGEAGWRATLMAAQLHRAQGDLEQAIRYFQEHVESARAAGQLSSVTLPAWLQLAACYTERGQHRFAADVFLLGASALPSSAVLWRGAGVCFATAGELESADMALSEANVLDPEDASAWAWLGLVGLRQGRQEDAEKALSYAMRCGVEDAGVMRAIAAEYGAAGQLREQQRVLTEIALRMQPESVPARLALARCLAAQRSLAEAEEALAAARQLAEATGSEEDGAAVAEAEAELRGGAGRQAKGGLGFGGGKAQVAPAAAPAPAATEASATAAHLACAKPWLDLHIAMQDSEKEQHARAVKARGLIEKFQKNIGSLPSTDLHKGLEAVVGSIGGAPSKKVVALVDQLQPYTVADRLLADASTSAAAAAGGGASTSNGTGGGGGGRGGDEPRPAIEPLHMVSQPAQSGQAAGGTAASGSEAGLPGRAALLLRVCLYAHPQLSWTDYGGKNEVDLRKEAAADGALALADALVAHHGGPALTVPELWDLAKVLEQLQTRADGQSNGENGLQRGLHPHFSGMGPLTAVVRAMSGQPAGPPGYEVGYPSTSVSLTSRNNALLEIASAHYASVDAAFAVAGKVKTQAWRVATESYKSNTAKMLVTRSADLSEELVAHMRMMWPALDSVVPAAEAATQGKRGGAEAAVGPLTARALNESNGLRAAAVRWLLTAARGVRGPGLTVVGAPALLWTLALTVAASELRREEAEGLRKARRAAGTAPAGAAAAAAAEGALDGPLAIQLLSSPALAAKHASSVKQEEWEWGPLAGAGAGAGAEVGVVVMSALACPRALGRVARRLAMEPGDALVELPGSASLLRGTALSPELLACKAAVVRALAAGGAAVVVAGSAQALEAAVVMLGQCRTELRCGPGRDTCCVPVLREAPNAVQFACVAMQERLGCELPGPGPGPGPGPSSSTGAPPAPHRVPQPSRRRMVFNRGMCELAGLHRTGPSPVHPSQTKLLALGSPTSLLADSHFMPRKALPVLVVLDCDSRGGGLRVLEGVGDGDEAEQEDDEEVVTENYLFKLLRRLDLGRPVGNDWQQDDEVEEEVQEGGLGADPWDGRLRQMQLEARAREAAGGLSMSALADPATRELLDLDLFGSVRRF